MIELAIGPQDRVVAALARRREAELRMIYRCGRRVVIIQMAGNAGGGRQIVIVVDVAIRADARWIRVRVG